MRWILLLCILLNYTFAIYDFTVDNYPDSLTSSPRCKIKKPSYLCDPWKVLDEMQPRVVEMLDRIRTDTVCLCEKFDALKRNCLEGVGSTVSFVTIFGDILTGYSDQRRDELQNYANELRKQLNRGQCDDDVLIVYSMKDVTFAISSGSVAAQALKSADINKIFHNANKSEPARAVMYILDQFHQYLNLAPPQSTDELLKVYWPYVVFGVLYVTYDCCGKMLFKLLIRKYCSSCCKKKECRCCKGIHYSPESRRDQETQVPPIADCTTDSEETVEPSQRQNSSRFLRWLRKKFSRAPPLTAPETETDLCETVPLSREAAKLADDERMESETEV